MGNTPLKILFFANTDWYLYNFRLGLAKYLVARGVQVIMVSPPGPYGELLQAEGFQWIPVPMERRSLHPVMEIKFLWQLFRVYRKVKPDIVHHFTIKCVVYGGMVAHFARTCNVVASVTGLGYVFIGKDILAKILRPIVRLFLKVAMNGSNRRLILQNPDDRELFLSAGLVDDKDIRLIAGSGVNIEKFKPASLAKYSAINPIRVVFAARLLWDKGIREFVDAAQILHAEGINAEFIIVGDADPGNPASVPEETLEIWQQLDSIQLSGHSSDMAALFETTDIMVLPSYREGLPRGLIEAAAAAIPIVTTDAPGCREVVDDGVNGYLVPVRDAVSLANAIRKLINNPELAIKMGIAGREKAIAEFDEQIIFDQTLQVYHEINPKLSHCNQNILACEQVETS